MYFEQIGLNSPDNRSTHCHDLWLLYNATVALPADDGRAIDGVGFEFSDDQLRVQADMYACKASHVLAY
jgi:hypothetical protein